MDWITTSTYWHDRISGLQTRYPPLQGSVDVDIAVIGGGITGLTTALHLKNAGKKVLLLEAGCIGAGTSGATSGHLDALPDQGVRKLIADFGEDSARAITQARMDAIGQIERWVQLYDIQCDFRRVPGYRYSELVQDRSDLQEECKAARKLGLEAVEDRLDVLPFRSAGGYRVEQQARFNSLAYLQALAEAFHGDGCAIHEHTRAMPPSGGSPSRIETEQGTVNARDVVLCTHSAYLGLSQFDMRIAPYQSYVLAVRVHEEMTDALYWDNADPYHYIRIASGDDPRLLIVGGQDHKTGQGPPEDDAYQQLEKYARNRFNVQEVEFRWSSELFEPADGLPYIGRAPLQNHLYLATGFSGTGLTYGTMAAGILCARILDRETSIDNIVAPARLKLQAAGSRLLRENLNVARRLVGDRLNIPVVHTLNHITAGQGQLVHYEGHARAVYRDPEGELHILAPQCTHAGCFVQWNPAEKTWDCPCHGGRYTATGERIYGPPHKDLAEAQIPAHSEDNR